MAVCSAVTFEVRHTRGSAVPFLGHSLDYVLALPPLHALKNPGPPLANRGFGQARDLERRVYMS